MRKCDVEKIMADAAEIVRRLRETDDTQAQIMREYRCGHPLIKKVVLSQISEKQWAAIRKKKLGQESAKGGGQFKIGHVPWDKGRKGIHLSPATEFKKGCMRGQAARNYRPVGTITIRHDTLPKRKQRNLKGGRLQKGPARRFIKITDDGPAVKRWIPLARYRWIKKYGPIPPGWFVVHKDGVKLNDNIENLLLVNQARNLALTHSNNPGLRKIARARAARSKKKNTIARRNLAKVYALVVWRWDCTNCAAGYERRPEKCTKCGKESFEKIELKSSAMRAESVTLTA